MRPWLDVPLDLDEGALAERWEGAVVLDREAIRALVHENHMSLWRSTPIRRDLSDGTAVVDLTLRCVAHPHSHCRFRWVRITLDFTAGDHIQVRDMAPRTQITTNAVELTIRTSPDQAFYDIGSVALTPDAAAERRGDPTVYFPLVTTSGPYFTYATWDFTAVEGRPLDVERDLRLLLTLASSVTTIPTTITLRGEVVVNGWAGRLPLIGRRTKEFTTHDLV